MPTSCTCLGLPRAAAYQQGCCLGLLGRADCLPLVHVAPHVIQEHVEAAIRRTSTGTEARQHLRQAAASAKRSLPRMSSRKLWKLLR